MTKVTGASFVFDEREPASERAEALSMFEDYPGLWMRAGQAAAPNYNLVIGHYRSNHPTYRALQVTLAQELGDLPATETSSGDFSSVRCVMNEAFQPLGTIRADGPEFCARYIAHHGLGRHVDGVAGEPKLVFTNEAVAREAAAYVHSGSVFTEAQLADARAHFSAAIDSSHFEPHGFKVKVASNPGLPSMTSGSKSLQGKRIAVYESLLVASNIAPEASALWRNKDWRALWALGLTPAYFKGQRTQPEKNIVDPEGKGRAGKKPREVVDWTDRVVVGRRRPSLMAKAGPGVRLSLAERLATDALANEVIQPRPRVVAMQPRAFSMPGKPLAAGIERALYHTCPFTFHHGGYVDVLRKANQRIPTAKAEVDAPWHDAITNDAFVTLLSEVCDTITGSKEYGIYVEQTFHAPTLSPADYYGARGIRVRGSITSPHLRGTKIVTPSGHDLTSVMAKLVGSWYIWVSLCRYEDHGPNSHLFTPENRVTGDRSERARRDFLNGLKAVVVFNAGDNGLIVLYGDSRYEGYLSSPLEWCPFTVLTEGGTFLGDKYILEGMALAAYPRVETFVDKTFVPDRDLMSVDRGDPILGYYAKLAHYERSPDFPAVLAACDRSVRAVLGLSLEEASAATSIFRDARKEQYGLDEALPPHVTEQFTADDWEVYLDPSKLQYKFEEHEIHPALHDHYYVKVAWSDFAHVTSTWFHI